MDFKDLVLKKFFIGRLASLDRMVDPDTLMGSIDVGFAMRYNPPKGIRLLGVDGPEMHSIDPKEKRAAGIVTIQIEDNLKYLLKVGQVWLVSKKWDMYGRVLADLYFKDPNDKDFTNLNDKYIKDGLLKFYDGKSARTGWTDDELDYVIEKYKLPGLPF
jgi:endonuclease YncB( thermonuclease family)